MNRSPIRLLLVEDEPIAVQIVFSMLAEAPKDSYDLVHVDRLSLALECLGEQQFDVVLLDLGLEDSRGLETITRTHARAPKTPIVVLTANDDDALALEAIGHGAQDFLIKPVESRSILTRVIRYAIERKRAEETLRSSEEALIAAQSALGLLLGRKLKLDEVSRIAVSTAIQISGMDTGTMYLVDPDSGEWTLGCQIGTSPEMPGAGARPACLRESTDVETRIADLPFYGSPRELAEPYAKLLKAGGVCVVCAHPLLLDKKLIGWLELFSYTPREQVSLSCQSRMESIVHQIVNAISRIRQDQALEISEQRLRRLFEQIPSGMLVTRPDGTILMANPSACHWLGLPNDAVGKPLRRWIPEEQALVSPERHEWQRAVTIVTADGKTRILGSTSVLIQLGSSDAIITVFRDIGRIREIEERRRRAEQLAQVGATAAKLSHEIKNPLASILTGLHILEQEVTYSSRHNSVLQDTIGDVRRLAEIIQELLGSSKPAEAYPAPMSLSGLLLDAEPGWSNYARNRGVALKVSDLPAEDVTVVVDQGLIRRVLFNLVLNAIEATGPEGQVQIAWRPVGHEEMEQRFPGFEGKVVAIEVRDNGPGISQASIEQIFKPFVTTKSAGTGLGLAISEEIINGQGGVLSVESRLGEGATFHIYLVVGDRPPCWEVARDACFKSCDDCPVYDRTPGYFCWSYLGQTQLSETGDWPDSCLECPMYRSYDLGQYYHRPDP